LGEWLGVGIAIVSSCLGGTAAAVKRYLVGNADPLTLAILRWGIGFVCVLPIALVLRVRWPSRKDWPAVAALGFCFFGLFFILYNIAVSYTTAARASLALSTLPLQTMVLNDFGARQWMAALYLGVGGGALAFILWVMAVQRASPTRVANTMAVKPIAAALLASQLVGEPITLNLVIGLVAVFAGIWIATTDAAKVQQGRAS